MKNKTLKQNYIQLKWDEKGLISTNSICHNKNKVHIYIHNLTYNPISYNKTNEKNQQWYVISCMTRLQSVSR